MLVIFNPVAGRSRASALWRVLDLLVENGVMVEVAETQHAGRARKRTARLHRPRVISTAGQLGGWVRPGGPFRAYWRRLGLLLAGRISVRARR